MVAAIGTSKGVVQYLLGEQKRLCAPKLNIIGMSRAICKCELRGVPDVPKRRSDVVVHTEVVYTVLVYNKNKCMGEVVQLLPAARQAEPTMCLNCTAGATSQWLLVIAYA